MRIGPATNVARINIAETITALWAFAHADGLKTDDIIERLAGSGVTIDGVKLKDTALWLMNLAAAGSNILKSTVTGDSQDRLRITADGAIAWGPGDAGRDVNLYRAVANTLKTDDTLHIGGDLIPLANLYVSSQDATLGAGDNDDVATGTVTLQRLTCNGAGSTVTGFAGGAAKRLLMVIHLGGGVMTLAHLDVGSAGANQLKCMDGTDVTTVAGGVTLWLYDVGVGVWCQVASN